MPKVRIRSQTFPLPKNIFAYKHHETENRPLIDQNDHGNFQVDLSPAKKAIATKLATLNTLKLKFSGLLKYQRIDSQADPSSSDEEVMTTALELIGSKLSMFLAQINNAMVRSIPILCDVLGKETLNIMGAALEFKYFYKHNHELWLETLCIKEVFNAAAQASHNMIAQAKREKKTIEPKKFNSTVDEAITDAIKKDGEILNNWGVNNHGIEINKVINTVKQYLSDFHAHTNVNNSNDYPGIHKKYKQELEKLKSQCMQRKNEQLYLHENFPDLEHILGKSPDSLNDMLRQNDKARSPLAKYPATVNGNKKIYSLSDFLSNFLNDAIQEYLLPTSKDHLAKRQLYVIIYLLDKNAVPKQNFLPNPTPNCAKVWELLYDLLENKIIANSNPSSPKQKKLLECCSELSTLCDKKLKQAITAEGKCHSSSRWAIFKLKHKNHSPNLSNLLPSQVVEIINSLYNKKLDADMLIEQISEINARCNNMMTSQPQRKDQRATL